jgi:hypothetical protein
MKFERDWSKFWNFITNLWSLSFVWTVCVWVEAIWLRKTSVCCYWKSKLSSDKFNNCLLQFWVVSRIGQSLEFWSKLLDYFIILSAPQEPLIESFNSFIARDSCKWFVWFQRFIDDLKMTLQTVLVSFHILLDRCFKHEHNFRLHYYQITGISICSLHCGVGEKGEAVLLGGPTNTEAETPRVILFHLALATALLLSAKNSRSEFCDLPSSANEATTREKDEKMMLKRQLSCCASNEKHANDLCREIWKLSHMRSLKSEKENNQKPSLLQNWWIGSTSKAMQITCAQKCKQIGVYEKERETTKNLQHLWCLMWKAIVASIQSEGWLGLSFVKFW